MHRFDSGRRLQFPLALFVGIACHDPPTPPPTQGPDDLPRWSLAPHVSWAGLDAPATRPLAVFVDDPGGPLDQIAADADVTTFLNDRFTPIFLIPERAPLARGVSFLDSEGCVLWLLVGLSVVCVAIAIERAIFASLNRTAKAPLEKALAAFLKGGSAQDLIQALAGMKGIEARVLQAGMDAATEGGAESAEEAIAGTILFERMKLERGLIILGTVGANAPFIGLFGTVLGIIRAFHELGQSAADAGAAVMSGISEALVATAVGLMVAIPAVVLY